MKKLYLANLRNSKTLHCYKKILYNKENEEFYTKTVDRKKPILLFIFSNNFFEKIQRGNKVISSLVMAIVSFFCYAFIGLSLTYAIVFFSNLFNYLIVSESTSSTVLNEFIKTYIFIIVPFSILWQFYLAKNVQKNKNEILNNSKLILKSEKTELLKEINDSIKTLFVEMFSLIIFTISFYYLYISGPFPVPISYGGQLLVFLIITFIFQINIIRSDVLEIFIIKKEVKKSVNSSLE